MHKPPHLLLGITITIALFILPITTLIGCKDIQQYDLIALKDFPTIKGQFFLGAGTINGTWQYTFYYRDGDAIKMGNCRYNYGEIYEGNYDNPYVIVTWDYRYKPPHIALAKFHIPPNTIINNITLDLE
jgi:hypothetical protein